jgi:DNA-binding CsgD family transcriptional regulator/PAS domain-containing protein
MVEVSVDQTFSDLLEALYEGPLEAVPWEGFLAQLREIMGAAATTLILQPPSDEARGVMLNAGGNLEGIASYNEQLFTLDPFMGLPVGEVVTLHEFTGEAQLLASDFYRLSLEPSGLYDILGADMDVPGEMEARLRVSRSKGRVNFTDQDKALVKALLPHLQRSIRIHARLNRIESERALYAGAVEQLAVATIILDETGAVLNTNARAAALLARCDGLSIDKGRLRLNSAEGNTRLHEVVSQVLSNQRSAKPTVVQALRVARPSGLSDLGLIVRPVPMNQWSEGTSVPTVAIFISDPDEASVAPQKVITQLFGFTPTEAKLAMLLTNGLTLDEAAEELSVSRNTARTHLRSLFAKTGVTRQTLLVRLILKSVAPLAVSSGP